MIKTMNVFINNIYSPCLDAHFNRALFTLVIKMSNFTTETISNLSTNLTCQSFSHLTKYFSMHIPNPFQESPSTEHYLHNFKCQRRQFCMDFTIFINTREMGSSGCRRKDMSLSVDFQFLSSILCTGLHFTQGHTSNYDQKMARRMENPIHGEMKVCNAS